MAQSFLHPQLENVILTTLKLAFNGFADKGSTALAEALEVNAVLRDLDLTCNRISDTGLARIAKALLINETLRCLRVSSNPLTTLSAVVLLSAIKSNPFSSLELVDMSGTHIYKDAVELLNDVRRVRENFYFLYAGTVRSTAALDVKKDAEGISSCNPLSILEEYIAVKGLRIIDLFKQFDKDGSGSVSRVEFIQGLKNMHVPLTEHQLDVLINTLDTDGNGEVDYGEFATGQRAYRRKSLRELNSKEMTTQRVAERRRLELEKFFSSPSIKESTEKSK